MKGSGMPQIRAAFGGWTRRITLTRRIQEVVDGLVTNTERTFTLRGTIQPLSARKLELKPEGERRWKWLQIHFLTNDASIIQPNDRLTHNGEIFKIAADSDYSLNGFIEYHAVKDYQDGVQ